MESDRVDCRKCGASILQVTFDRTGGVCMPCKNGTRKQMQREEAKVVYVSICIGSDQDANSLILESDAGVVSKKLMNTRHIGDSKHANKYEMVAQRKLVEHTLRYKVDFELNDDHWARTSYAFMALFEGDEATLLYKGSKYSIEDIDKEEWTEGDEPLAMQGGFLYRLNGVEIFKRMTWVS